MVSTRLAQFEIVLALVQVQKHFNVFALPTAPQLLMSIKDKTNDSRVGYL